MWCPNPRTRRGEQDQARGLSQGYLALEFHVQSQALNLQCDLRREFLRSSNCTARHCFGDRLFNFVLSVHTKGLEELAYAQIEDFLVHRRPPGWCLLRFGYEGLYRQMIR